MAFTVTVGGNDITANVLISTVRIHQAARNTVGTCSFECLDDGAALTVATKDAVVIDDGGTTYFKGEVAGEPQRIEIAPNKLRWMVDCQDYNQLLKETVVEDDIYASGVSDKNAIINLAGTGLFPKYRADIDSNTYVVEVDSTTEELEFVAITLAAAMQKICNLTGARWYVDYDKKLHYFDPDNASTNADGLSDNPDDVNTFRYWNMTRREDVGIINRVYIQGRGVADWVIDAASVSTYGDRELAIKDESIVTAQGITDRGTAILDYNKQAAETYTMKTLRGGFSVGELVELTSSVYSLAAEAKMIIAIETTFLTGSQPVYEITAGDELDDMITRQQQQDETLGDTWQSGNVITLYAIARKTLTYYEPTSTGFDTATADAAAGDVVWLPAKTIGGNHTLKEDVRYIGLSRWGSILTGAITMEPSTTLEVCSITRTADNADDLKGIIGPASGEARLRDVQITCVQAGAGDAYGVAVESGGSVESWGCYIQGDSTGGAGYAGYTTSGNFYVHGGRCGGSTDEFN